MLIPFDHLVARHAPEVTGVLHVGAHLGEEAEAYAAAGVSTVVWVEGNPELLGPLRARVAPLGHRVLQALVSDRSGEVVDFHVADNGQSSSLLAFGTHTAVAPDVRFTHDLRLETTTLDLLCRAEAVDLAALNFLNMDLQGAEMMALRGAEEVLRHMRYLYLEVNVDELYVGCARLPELDRHLADRGFARVDTAMAGAREGLPHGDGWGDALWVRSAGGAPQPSSLVR